MSARVVGEAVVWRTGALGDFVLTLPVLSALREHSERLMVIAPARYKALFDRADHWVDSDGLEARNLLADGKLGADLGLAWTPGAARALRNAGVKIVFEGTPHPAAGVHQVDALWSPLVPWLGVRDREPRLPVQAGPGTSIVLCPGSGGRGKRWGLDHWHAVAAAVDDVVWVGGPQERDEPGWGRPARFDLDLRGLMELAASCRCWLGPDAGPQHLAAACGARVGTVFVGATAPDNWAPRGAKVFGAGVTPAEVARWASSFC